MNETSNMGNRICELRKSAGLTQEQLASKLNISAQAVSKWETGSSYPDIAILPALCSILGVSTDELLGTAPMKNSAEERADAAARPHPFNKDTLVFGILVILMGLAFLLDRTHLIPLPKGVSVWAIVWPAVLLWVAVSFTIKHFNLFSLALVLIGIYFLLLNLGIITAFLTWGILWPCLLVLLGISIAYSAMFGRNRRLQMEGGQGRKRSSYEEKDGYIRLSCSFCGMNEHPVGSVFRGGEVSVSFGEGVLDLTGFHSFSPEAVLKADCSFGELKLLLPKDMRVDMNVSRSFASVEEKNRSDSDVLIGSLKIVGSVSFGTIEVSYR